jgi:hypothetical protein
MMHRLRNAWRALTTRKPTITVEVMSGAWSCRWERMTAGDAARIAHDVADVIANRALAQMPCSATVH